MKYKLTLLALLIPTAVFAQSKGVTEAAGFYDKTNPGQQAGYNNTARAAGEGPNNVSVYSAGNVYLNAGLYGAEAAGYQAGGRAAVNAATPGAIKLSNALTGGTKSTANSAANTATSTANSAASGASSATNSAVSGASSAASSAGNTVKGWF